MKLEDVRVRDLRDYLNDNLVDMAEEHFDCWKDRYAFKKMDTIEFDLRVNHDDSLEIELVEDGIGRKLKDEERDQVSELFINAVLKYIDEYME